MVDVFAVGDWVEHEDRPGCVHAAIVREVYENGDVRVEWAGPEPHPFFTAPYHPEELRKM